MRTNNSNHLACFTIGYSNHEVEKLIALLNLHQIQYILDVRSAPYSQRNPQYNRENIKLKLEKNNICYVFMGNLLGARYENPDLYFFDKQVVDFKKIRKLESFKQGVKRVIDYLGQNNRIALMCAEKDPFNCHRFVLISYSLVKEGIVVKHILDNGSVITNDLLEDRLISKYKIDYKQQTFFEENKTKRNAIEKGYLLRNKDIGYSKQKVTDIIEQ